MAVLACLFTVLMILTFHKIWELEHFKKAVEIIYFETIAAVFCSSYVPSK